MIPISDCASASDNEQMTNYVLRWRVALAVVALLGIIALVWRFLNRAQWWWLWGV
jgi:hypothetical protein